ncbi:gamma-aminobutyrate:alpha-ketoglutarate aminotransferase [Vibrio sp. JCM 18905]|nr:gamma-aminobutyrate:alpha-ketoglutarate aminotransferase [Vibrio sp. JCM 18905]
MSNKTQQLLEIDRQRVFHASTHLKQYAAGGELSGRIISSGSGIRITDSEGIELIDALPGCIV